MKINKALNIFAGCCLVIILGCVIGLAKNLQEREWERQELKIQVDSLRHYVDSVQVSNKEKADALKIDLNIK